MIDAHAVNHFFAVMARELGVVQAELHIFYNQAEVDWMKIIDNCVVLLRAFKRQIREERNGLDPRGHV